jgi:hypothetical protein
MSDIEDNELETLRKVGIKWSLLSCLYKVLREIDASLPPSLENKLEVARCIIETGCQKPQEAEKILKDVEEILAKRTNEKNDENLTVLLSKINSDPKPSEEILESPLMKNLVNDYQFLSYLISE